MIRSFADRDAEGLFHGRFARRLAQTTYSGLPNVS